MDGASPRRRKGEAMTGSKVRVMLGQFGGYTVVTNRGGEGMMNLIERLEHFEQHQIEEGDQYGAEVLNKAQKRIAILEAKVKMLEHKAELHQQMSVFKDAKAAALNDPPDYVIAVYQLRDLPFTKEAGLSDLAWAMDREGNVSKADWEFFRDEWLGRWRKTLAAAQEQSDETK